MAVAVAYERGRPVHVKQDRSPTESGANLEFNEIKDRTDRMCATHKLAHSHVRSSPGNLCPTWGLPGLTKT